MSDTIKLATAATLGAAAAGLAVYISKLPKRSTTTLVESNAVNIGSKYVNTTLSKLAAPVSGTMVLCVQNLAVSGANQVLLNLVEGCVWKGNVVLLSPSLGPFAKEFAALGVAVRIGLLSDLLNNVRDVRVAICNTI